MTSPPSPAVVLVHSPLVGPLTWRRSAGSLEALGHRVVVPSLTPGAVGEPSHYRERAAAAAAAVTGACPDGPVVLAGHSGAGPLLPAIADALPGRVRGAVFVDALLPHPGTSWFDTAPPALAEQLRGLAEDGWLPPWHAWFPPETIGDLVPDTALRERFAAENPRLPLAYFAEPAPVVPGWPPGGCAYVRLSEAYDAAAAEAARLGWPVRRADADHLAVLTRPCLVAELLDEAVSSVSPDHA